MITAYDTQKVTSALISGIVAQEMKRQDAERQAERAAEMDRLRAELGVRRDRDSRYYAARIAEAEAMYGKNPEMGRLHRAVLGLVGMAVLIHGGKMEA